MNALKSIYALATFIGLFILAIAGFNYSTDAFCFFRCDVVDVNRQTVNLYYQVAQRVLAYPDTEQIVLGSSRGESIPLKSLQNETGLKTLNLSVGGSEVKSKLAYLSFATKNLKLKRVIWIADYFEISTSLSDPRLLYSPALSSEAPSELKDSASSERIGRLSRIIDRQTLEASFKMLSVREYAQISPGINNVTLEECLEAEAKKDQTPETLAKEVDLLYHSYVHGIFAAKENPKALQELKKALASVSHQGIEVLILIPPYNPRFSKNLEQQSPQIYHRHLDWLKQVHSLATDKIRVVDYFLGIPDTEDSPQFWSDGVHFTCAATQIMFKQAL